MCCEHSVLNTKESPVDKVTAKWVRITQAGSHFGDQGLVKEKNEASSS